MLRALVERGLARRIEPAGAPALFELRVGDNHHHLVRRSCGAVADAFEADGTVGDEPISKYTRARTLNRMPEDFFSENEQIAFGTGVLVDGLDFSDDKMLVGRAFSCSDTQRYRVRPNYKRAGELYLLSEQWEKDDLVADLVDALPTCDRPIQERMGRHFFMVEEELGQRVGEGLGISADDVRGLAPLQTQTLTEEELQRAANLGKSGPRDVSGLVMTHCVPNGR